MKKKQLAKDLAKSGTVRLNTLIPLIVTMLPQFGVTVTPEMVTLGTAILNIGWKIFQKAKNAGSDK